MDPPQDNALAMAQAMGFSSFGSQARPQKRRKFHTPQHPPPADPSAPSSAVPSTARPASASLPLKPPVQGPPAAHDLQETLNDNILLQALNDNEIDLGDDNDNDSLDGGATINTPLTPNPPPDLALPRRPPQVSSHGGSHDGSHRGSHGGFHGGPRGGSHSNTRPWYQGYYDPTSNENPWKRIEAGLGLPSRGSWLTRD